MVMCVMCGRCTVVVLRMMSTSSLSSGTTSSTKRGIVGTTGGAAINAAFLALKRNLGTEESISMCWSKFSLNAIFKLESVDTLSFCFSLSKRPSRSRHS